MRNNHIYAGAVTAINRARARPHTCTLNLRRVMHMRYNRKNHSCALGSPTALTPSLPHHLSGHAQCLVLRARLCLSITQSSSSSCVCVCVCVICCVSSTSSTSRTCQSALCFPRQLAAVCLCPCTAPKMRTQLTYARRLRLRHACVRMPYVALR